MARRKVSPEAQIIALFTGLSEEGKRMVMFGLNAIMSNNNPPEASTRTRTPRASRGQAAPVKIVPAADPEPTYIGPNCGICGNPEDHSDHDRAYLKSHDFEAPKSSASSVAKKSSRKSAGTSSTPNTEGATENALAASSAGD